MKNEKGLFIKSPYYWRVPRKLKKQIPKDTHYCYIPLSKPGIMEDGKWGYYIKVCPFYTHIKYKDMKPIPEWMDQEFLDEYSETKSPWCKLAKCDVMDQCKSCGLKTGRYDI